MYQQHQGSGVIEQDATHKPLWKDSEIQENPQSATPEPRLSAKLYSWLETTGSVFPVGLP